MRRQLCPPPVDGPLISVVRPVCGIDACDALTLRSSFDLDYPKFELVFCSAEANDPAAVLVRALIDEHPHVRARLLIGDDQSTSNPKLNNVIKGWEAAAADWVVIADSNVLMPPDYLQRMLSSWLPDTGLLCSPPIGCMAENFWAELECAFLNTYQARWQYFADTVGLGFAQGKTLFWPKPLLDRAGGIRALGQEVAEDAAATKIVRGLGLKVRLVDGPFGQPLGRRGALQVWHRQLRWARLRRVTFPLFFFPEILTGIWPPLIALSYAANAADVPVTLVVVGLMAVWYGSEAWLAYFAGWRLSMLSLPGWILRDALLPILWGQAWFGSTLSWRGHEVPLSSASRTGP